MWKTLSPILNKRKKTSGGKAIDKLIINGKNVYNDKEIANSLNDYFSNIGSDL